MEGTLNNPGGMGEVGGLSFSEWSQLFQEDEATAYQLLAEAAQADREERMVQLFTEGRPTVVRPRDIYRRYAGDFADSDVLNALSSTAVYYTLGLPSIDDGSTTG